MVLVLFGAYLAHYVALALDEGTDKTLRAVVNYAVGVLHGVCYEGRYHLQYLLLI